MILIDQQAAPSHASLESFNPSGCDLGTDAEAPSTAREDLLGFYSAILTWPLATKLSVIALIALYIPVFREATHAWLTNDQYAHGIFILPISVALLWLARKEILHARPQPTSLGLIPLAIGLLMQVGGYLLNIGFLAILSIVPVLAGLILVLHGRNLWRVTAFAVCFLAFASTIPGSVIFRPSQWLQSASTIGAFEVIDAVGIPAMRSGNLIEILGMQLEVAEVCSGFKKLLALVAFSVLYGYLFRVGRAKRILLILAAFPIALLANMIRIAGLVIVASVFRETGLKVAHDLAEVTVLILAFGMFVVFGKLIGCRTLRFSL